MNAKSSSSPSPGYSFWRIAGLVVGIAVGFGGLIFFINQLSLLIGNNSLQTVEKSAFNIAEITAVIGGFALLGQFQAGLTSEGRRRMRTSAIALLFASVGYTVYGFLFPMYEVILTDPPPDSIGTQIFFYIFAFSAFISLVIGFIFGPLGLGIGFGNLIMLLGDMDQFSDEVKMED